MLIFHERKFKLFYTYLQYMIFRAYFKQGVILIIIIQHAIFYEKS